MARVARIEKGFYVPPEPKLAFVIRIKGINKMHPKVRRTDPRQDTTGVRVCRAARSCNCCDCGSSLTGSSSASTKPL